MARKLKLLRGSGRCEGAADDAAAARGDTAHWDTARWEGAAAAAAGAREDTTRLACKCRSQVG